MNGCRLRAAVLVGALVVGSMGCAGSTGRPGTADGLPALSLAARIRAVTSAPPLDRLLWGILAVDVATGRVLFAHDGARKFIPASNMKIPVTAAALERLGPGYRFVTPVHAVGPLEGDVLDGDIVVTGVGDPTLSARFWPDPEAPLLALADSVAAAGIRRVTGRLVVDVSGWDSTTVAESWMWGNLSGAYSANPGAFVVAEGETHLRIEGGAAPGAPAEVRVEPPGRPGFVRADVVTGSEEAEPHVSVGWLPESRQLHVQGSVPPGGVVGMEVATRDPVRQAAAALGAALERRGIEVAGGWNVAWSPGEALATGCASGDLEGCSGARRIAALASPPLTEIVAATLGASQNFIAEQLARALGRSDTTRASWSAGRDAVARYLVEDVGLDSLAFRLHDASGMSAYDLLSPEAVVAVLRHELRAPWGPAFRAALAEPGEEGTTLESRLQDLQGRLWGKTGTLANVNSLSGLLRTRDGRDVAFSILSNGSGIPSDPVRSAIDDVVRILAEDGDPGS